jgi:nucleoid-associated protein YgaU
MATRQGQQAPATWTVQTGDHFWSIAQRHLATVLGEAPSQERVDRYWRRLVDANRDRLRDPANIDLIYPGQVLRLPPVGHHSARR